MKTKLAIFDLDDTLIRGDSFRMLILEQVKKNPHLAILVALRAIKLIGRKTFAKQAHKYLLPYMNRDGFKKQFAEKLKPLICEDVLEKISECKSKGCKLVLISASPHDYVAYFAKLTGFAEGFGSDWRNGRYEHLHGSGKLEFLRKQYPTTQYDWHYAISDSPSDYALLNSCTNHEIWNGNV